MFAFSALPVSNHSVQITGCTMSTKQSYFRSEILFRFFRCYIIIVFISFSLFFKSIFIIAFVFLVKEHVFTILFTSTELVKTIKLSVVERKEDMEREGRGGQGGYGANFLL